MPLDLIYITNKPEVALIAEKNGVGNIMIDLETLGKEERQKNMDTVKSHHTVSDVMSVSGALTVSELLVRIDPMNPGSEEQIDAVIAAGADKIMLPMWKSADDVGRFISCVNGRVKTVLLLETKEAVECIDEVLDIGGFDEIHIGLNDLHLSYGLTFMFELLSNGVLEGLCSKFKAHGVKYGFGGIARIGEGMLPAERIVMEHYRLGSSAAILSRSFCNSEVIKNIDEIDRIFFENMALLRDYEKTLICSTDDEFESNRHSVKQCVDMIVAKIREVKGND